MIALALVLAIAGADAAVDRRLSRLTRMQLENARTRLGRLEARGGLRSALVAESIPGLGLGGLCFLLREQLAGKRRGVVGLALLTLGVCFHLFYLLAIALNLTILIWRTS